MQGNKLRLVWKCVFVASLLSPLVLLSSKMLPLTGSGGVFRISQEIIYPVQLGWHQVVSSTQEVWQRYIALSEAASENQQLRQHLALLKAKQLDYNEKIQEIARLRRILGFNQHYQTPHEVAEVVSHPKDMAFEILRISKGTQSGLQVGMPVVTGEGVLGRIIRVGFWHSDVQLLVDANFHLDVLLARTRARGVLRGNFDNQCVLKLNRRAEVKIGDTLISSGIVGGFPKGIPVGRVVRISYDSDNITQIVNVEPWVHYSKVEEVVVLKTLDEDTRKIINTAGQEWLSRSIDAIKGL